MAGRLLVAFWCVSTHVLANNDIHLAPVEQTHESQTPDTVAQSVFESSDDINEGEMLESLQKATEEALMRHERDAQEYEALQNQVTALMEENNRFDLLEQELLERSAALDTLIREVNAIQMEYLAWQLNETLQNELRLRAPPQQEEPIDDLSNIVSLEELRLVLSPDRILQRYEGTLDEWLSGIIREEVADFHAGNMDPSDTCVTPVEAVQLVQASLVNHAHDGLGMVDHAQGSSIVHELTSETYEPPAEYHERLGNVWWRKYIPEDWERLLSPGWQDWNIRIPSYIQHTLGLRGGPTMQPEAILQSNTHPGSCWPMKGNKGQVTLRLPYPIKISAVTVDHASPLLLDEQDTSSAPRLMRIVVYPPCDKSHCHGLGFDVKQGRELATFEFDMTGKGVQTFDIKEAEPGSCSGGSEEEAPSCDDLPDPIEYLTGGKKQQPDIKDAVGGITVEVVNNWGIDDYTCLYRFRVHGEQLQGRSW